MNNDFASFVDTLRKLDAKNSLLKGGNQYTIEVALGPSSSAKGQALMRAKKAKPAQTIPLQMLVARVGK